MSIYIFKFRDICANLRIFVEMSICMSDFVKTWPLGFRLAPGAAQLLVSAVSKKVAVLPSWSVQLDSLGTALTVGGWIRPGGQN